MLYQSYNSNTSIHPLEPALGQLRSIVSKRLQARPEHTGLETSLAGLAEQIHPGIFPKLPLLSNEETFILLLAMVPHLQADFFDSVIAEYFPEGGNFPEFGGVKEGHHRGMIPTGETAQFILGGNDLHKRLQVQRFFREDHLFFKLGMLWLEPVKTGEPLMSGRIILAQEWVEKLLFGIESPPRFGLDFPARHIETEMVWDDLVLHPRTLQQVQDIYAWLEYHPRLAADQNLKRKIRPGYRVLFYGPSGTGKTLTAALLGKEFQKDVFRIDLSQIVSKYIGETEKNLENVFKKAEAKNWILFFDEADALFGKRTNVQSAHDKYANQEVSYLLQRVEDYRGLLILASNFKNNLDEAFLRRFHAVLHFPMPGVTERLQLWQKSLPASLELHPAVSLQQLAEKYELSGASILNIVQHAALQAFACKQTYLSAEDILAGIRQEFLKEEKSV